MQFTSFVSLVEKFPVWSDSTVQTGRFCVWNDGVMYSVEMVGVDFHITFDEMPGVEAPFEVVDGMLRYTGTTPFLASLGPIHLWQKVRLR